MSNGQDIDEGDLDQAAEEGTLSAAEGAVPLGSNGVAVPPPAEVFVGEIPSSDDPTTMLWTARCSEQHHDLLGHFLSREEAEQAKEQHLKGEHRR